MDVKNILNKKETGISDLDRARLKELVGGSVTKQTLMEQFTECRIEDVVREYLELVHQGNIKLNSEQDSLDEQRLQEELNQNTCKISCLTQNPADSMF